MYYKKLDYYYKMWYTISSYKGVIDMSNDVVNEMNNTLIKQINEIKKILLAQETEFFWMLIKNYYICIFELKK